MPLSEAQSAIVSLQRRALRSRESYTIDVVDRALDEIVRNYDNPKPAPWQVRSALANAAKVVRGRREVVAPVDFRDERGSQPGVTDAELELVDVRDWLDRTPALSDTQRRLLVRIADGDDAVELAADSGVPIPRMRERIARARSRARQAYVTEAVA